MGRILKRLYKRAKLLPFFRTAFSSNAEAMTFARIIPILGFVLCAVPALANTPPTIGSFVQTATVTGTGSPVTSPSVSWNNGDLVIVIAGSETNATFGNPTTTGTGLTFTTRQSNNTASTCGAILATAVASATSSGTISSTDSNTSLHRMMSVWVFSGASTRGLGNTAKGNTAALTVSVTPAGGADSSFVWGVFDFGANSTLQTITPTPTNTRFRVQDGTSYDVYVADLHDQVSAGATSYGISGPGSGPFTIMVAEIEGLVSGSACTPRLMLTHAGGPC
jgi:hypothetical protein